MEHKINEYCHKLTALNQSMSVQNTVNSKSLCSAEYRMQLVKFYSQNKATIYSRRAELSNFIGLQKNLAKYEPKRKKKFKLVNFGVLKQKKSFIHKYNRQKWAFPLIIAVPK